jgi:hypothetical protein
MELSNSRSTEWYRYGSNRSFTPDRSSTGPDRSVPINEHTHGVTIRDHAVKFAAIFSFTYPDII